MIENVARNIARLIKGEYELRFILFRLYLRKGSFPKLLQTYFNREEIPAPQFAHNIIPLELRTYIGFRQTMHPDVVHHNSQYFMSITPFPYSCSKFENPCTYYSNDGRKFLPMGKQPLAKRDGGYNYLSDPAIALKNKQYTLYYRECTVKDNVLSTKIWKTTSTDFINWTEHKEILNGAKLSFICPSILDTSEERYVYYVEDRGNNVTGFCRCNEKGGRLWDFDDLELSGLPEGRILWHIDINAYKKILVGLMTLSKNTEGKDSKLYMGVSYDGGNSWDITKEIFLFDNQNEFFAMIYKSSLVEIDKTKDKYNLYFSAMTKKEGWYTYIVEDFNVSENL